MADFGALLNDLRDGLDGENPEGALNDFKEKLAGTDYSGIAEKFKLENGKLQFGGADFDVTTEKVEAYNTKWQVGDVDGALHEVFPDSAFDDEAFKEMVPKLEAERATNPAVIREKALQDSQTRGTDAKTAGGEDPVTNKQLNDAVDKIKKELEDKAKKDGTGKITQKDVEGWVKGIITLGLIGGGIAGIIAAIKDHQNKMNGCWLVNKQNGSKQKVKLLTCNSKNQTGTMALWGQVAPFTGPPTVNGATCQQTALSPCCDKKTNGNVQRICLENRLDKNGQPIIGTNPKNPQPVCKSCAPQCKGPTCSSYCSCSSVTNCPKGTYLTCVNVDFWGAAGDFLGDALGGLIGGFLKALWRVAKWIILAVGIVILAIVAWKIITFIISETKGKKSGFGLGWKRRPPRLR